MSNDKQIDGKCNAQTRDGGFCANPPVTGSKRCRMHGGTADNAGENNGNYKHGLYAEIGLTEEERDLMETIEEDLGDIEMYDLLLEHQLARYLRAADVVDEPAITPDYTSEGFTAGESLDMNDGPLANRAGLISGILDKKSKAEHRVAKIDDGVKQRVESSLDDDSQAAIIKTLDSLTGDDSE